MSTTYSCFGRGPASGGNENHDSDPTKTTMGETVGQERPAGTESIVDKAAPDLARAGEEATRTYPDGPKVEDSPRELDAARGNTKRS